MDIGYASAGYTVRHIIRCPERSGLIASTIVRAIYGAPSKLSAIGQDKSKSEYLDL